MMKFFQNDTWQTRLMALLFVAIAAITILVNMNRGLFADDDNLWFHLLTYKIIDSDVVTAEENKMVELFKADQATENQIIRLTDKREYTYNYLVPTVLWTVGRMLVAPFTDHLSYEKQLSYAMYAGFGLSTVVAFTIFLLIAWRLKLPVRYWYALTGMALLALIGCLLPGPKPPNFMILNEYRNDAIRLMTYFFQDPSYSFSAFSFTGRNNYLVLVLGAFLARWTGRDTWAYVILAAAVVWHASMGMMALVTFVLIDLATRPYLLRRAEILLTVTLAIVYYIAVESIWKKMGIEALHILVPIIVLLGMYVLLVPRLSLPAALSGVQKWLARCIADHRPAVDLSLFTVGWLVTLPIAAHINNQVEFTQSLYFWSQLHIRIFSVWQPAFVLFLVYSLLSPRPQQWRTTAVMILGLFLCLTSVGYMTARKEFSIIPLRLQPTAQYLEHAATGQNDLADYKKYGIVMPEDCYLPEAMVYYLIIKQQATGTPAVEDYLSRRPQGMRLDCSPR